MPIRSSRSSASARPAVSTRRTGQPRKSVCASIASRVVPGISVTSARSVPRSALKSDDLPAFGRPASTSRAPCRMRSAEGAVARRRRDPGPGGLHGRRDPIGRHGAVVLTGEVDLVAQERLQLDQRFPQFGDPLRQPTVQPAEGGPRLGRRRGVDQLAHRLRLDQVQLAVQHRAAGELTRRRVPGSGGVQRREEPGRRQLPSVAGQLDHVLAGVAVRTGKDGVEPAIDRLAVMMERGQRGDPRAVGAEALDYPCDDGEGPQPAHTHDRQGRAAGRCGERRDGVGEHGGNYHFAPAWISGRCGSASRGPTPRRSSSS